MQPPLRSSWPWLALLGMHASVIPVLVINLKRSEDRRAFIRRQLDGLGIAFQFFDAVDARDLSPADIQTSAPGGGVDYCGMLTVPEIACAVSHLRAIRS